MLPLKWATKKHIYNICIYIYNILLFWLYNRDLFNFNIYLKRHESLWWTPIRVPGADIRPFLVPIWKTWWGPRIRENISEYLVGRKHQSMTFSESSVTKKKLCWTEKNMKLQILFSESSIKQWCTTESDMINASELLFFFGVDTKMPARKH